MSLFCQFSLPLSSFALEISLDLPSERFITIGGESGSGKTTLLRLIAGLEKHTHHIVRYQQQTWQDREQFISPEKRRIGYLNQIPTLFPHLTAEQNIAYAQKRAPKNNPLFDPNSLYELLNIKHCLTHYPATLSGGEKQRIAIARMLASAPQCMLFDEAFTGIDKSNRYLILEHLKQLAAQYQLAIIYVTHNHEEIALFSDYHLVLSQGKITEANNNPAQWQNLQQANIAFTGQITAIDSQSNHTDFTLRCPIQQTDHESDLLALNDKVTFKKLR